MAGAAAGGLVVLDGALAQVLELLHLLSEHRARLELVLAQLDRVVRQLVPLARERLRERLLLAELQQERSPVQVGRGCVDRGHFLSDRAH